MAQITPGTPEALTALLTQIRQGTAPGSADPAAAGFFRIVDFGLRI
jgi:hypothetical protein